jgi:hypothetical protein
MRCDIAPGALRQRYVVAGRHQQRRRLCALGRGRAQPSAAAAADAMRWLKRVIAARRCCRARERGRAQGAGSQRGADSAAQKMARRVRGSRAQVRMPPPSPKRRPTPLKICALQKRGADVCAASPASESSPALMMRCFYHCYDAAVCRHASH